MLEAVMGAIIGVAAGFMLQQWWETYKSDRAVLRDLQAQLTLLARAQREKDVLTLLLAVREQGNDPYPDMKADPEDLSRREAEINKMSMQIARDGWKLQGSRYSRLVASVMVAVTWREPKSEFGKRLEPLLTELGETLNPSLFEEFDRQKPMEK